MKKFLLLILIFSQSNFCDAQTAFNNSTSFNQSDLFGKTFLNSKAKKKKLFQGCELALKVGLHISDTKANHYTSDTLYCLSRPNEQALSYHLHYLIIPNCRINFCITNKFFLFNKHFFIETGIQKISKGGTIKKTNGSSIAQESSLCPYYTYDSTLENYIRFKGSRHYFEIPIQIGIEWKRISFSFGLTRILETVNIYKKVAPTYKKADIEYLFLDKPYTDNVHGQINLSIAAINKKIKLSPFITTQFDRIAFSKWAGFYVTVGIELGYNFKEKK